MWSRSTLSMTPGPFSKVVDTSVEAITIARVLLIPVQVELGDVLLRCFDSPSGVPYSDVTLHTGVPHGPKWETHSTVSEVTSIQLEFRELSRLTGDSRYRAAADATLEKVQAQLPAAGLVPQFISPDTGQLRSGRLTLGARADSYYEYLLKQWLQSCKTEEKLVQSFGVYYRDFRRAKFPRGLN